MGNLAREHVYRTKRDLAREEALAQGRKRRALQREAAIRREQRRELKVDIATQKLEKTDNIEVSLFDKIVLIGGIFLICLAMFGMVFVSAFCADVQSNINKLDEEKIVLVEEIKALKVEIEATRSLGSIEVIATDKLGMHYPNDGQMVFMETDTRIPNNFSDLIRSKVYKG
jgi:cell division protein FtsL